MQSQTERQFREERLERINDLAGFFGIQTRARLYELVREKANTALQDGSAELGIPKNDLTVISLWSDESFRQCILERGGGRYRALIDLICHVFAEFDQFGDSADEKYRSFRSENMGADSSRFTKG